LHGPSPGCGNLVGTPTRGHGNIGLDFFPPILKIAGKKHAGDKPTLLFQSALLGEDTNMTNTSKVTEIRMLAPSEAGRAAAVLGRGMRDNPLHVAALGLDPVIRERALTGVFRSFLAMEMAAKGRVLGAFRDGTLAGVCGMMRPGVCQLTPVEKAALLPKLLWNCGIGGTGKLLSQFGNWSKHDPAEPHWHLGPVGVEREFQGQGIGSLLLREFGRWVDDQKAAAWLETDKDINVAFYRKHGFVVVAEDAVNGVPNWFMKRESKT
jgi:ribosomal protein S18 acetylase RimI-like enzyme